MNLQGDPHITRMLDELAAGDSRARADVLLPAVYQQLRAIAQQQMANERTGHTLSATALVHEAYLRLLEPREKPWGGRGHFHAAAAQAMQRILIDHARSRVTAKRGGPEARKAALDLSCLPELTTEDDSEGLLILDEAICRLERVDADAAKVVRLKFFAGLTNEQAAETMDVSAPTVKRHWAFARGWLKQAIENTE